MAAEVDQSNSLSVLIDKAQANILGFLDSQASVISADGSLLSPYMFIALTPFAVWLCILGVKLMLGLFADGEAIRKELIRVFLLFLVLIMGSMVFQTVNSIGNEFGSFIMNKSTSNKIMVQLGMDGKKQEFDISKFFSTEEIEKFKAYNANQGGTTQAAMVLSTWDIVGTKFTSMFGEKPYGEALRDKAENSEDALANTAKIQKELEVFNGMNVVNKGEVGVLTPLELLNRYQALVEGKSILDMTFAQVINYTLYCIGKLFKCIMLIFQKLIITMMQMSFPFAIVLSLLPSMERTWESWLQNYIAITLLGVTIAIVSVFQELAAFSVIGEPVYSIILTFVTGIMYLLSPALNTILFGGSGAIAGLPGQIVQTGAATAGIATKIFNKVTSMPSSPFKGNSK